MQIAPIFYETLLLRGSNEAFARSDSLSPFGPASVVQLSIFLREASFCEGCIDDGRIDPGTAAIDDWFCRIDPL